MKQIRKVTNLLDEILIKIKEVSKKMRYLIQPRNEGQDLNYYEIRKFKTLKECKKYVHRMTKMLAKALPEGEISVAYEKY